MDQKRCCDLDQSVFSLYFSLSFIVLYIYVFNPFWIYFCEFCHQNTLVIANTLFQQHKRQLCTIWWTSPDSQYQSQIDYILCSQSWRSSIQSAKTRPGANCGLDYDLLTKRFRLKLKKVGKTTRAFRYDLHQIPYDYTSEGKSNAVKNSIAQEPEMLGPWIKVNWTLSHRRWQEWTSTF